MVTAQQIRCAPYPGEGGQFVQFNTPTFRIHLKNLEFQFHASEHFVFFYGTFSRLALEDFISKNKTVLYL